MSNRPKIVIGADEHDVNDQAAAAIAADDTLFQRGRTLVRVLGRPETHRRDIDHPAGPEIVPVALPTLREKLARFADFRKVISGKEESQEVPDHPPHWCVQALHVRGEYPGVRHLSAVVDFPIIRPDGSVCLTPGYDRATEVYVSPWEGTIAVPSAPTQDDARAAVGELLDVVTDFPFRTPAHRAAWVAGLLTPLARFAFDGPTPLFLIEANVPGAGKGLLADIISLVVSGTRFAVAQYSHDPIELRKCITAAAISGDRMILFDNVAGLFGNEALDAVLTSTTWKGRVLGESREVTLPLRATWYATGNNFALKGDLARRVVSIDLHSKEERPDERSGFNHPDLRGWVRENRPRLLVAALTILAAHARAGRPLGNLTPFGSFEGWSRTVRAAIVWAGLPDPAETRVALRSTADAEVNAMRCILEGWEKVARGRWITVQEFVAAVVPTDASQADQSLAELRAAVEELTHGKKPEQISTVIGTKFRNYRGRVIGGRHLEQSEGKAAGRYRWRVLAVDGGGGGHGGHVSTTPTSEPEPLTLFTDSSPASVEKHPPCPPPPPCSGEGLSGKQRSGGLSFDLSIE